MAASSGPDLVRMQAISKSFPGVQALDDCHFELRAGEVHALCCVEASGARARPGIGYKCVDSAVKAIKGESLPKSIDTGYYWYDKTNIDDPKIKAVLYD